MKYLYATLLTCSLLLTSQVGVAFAQSDATPSAEDVTQTLKDRVQKVLRTEEGKVEGSTTTAKTTFGLVGTLQKVVGSTLQIVTVQGPTRIAELDKGATILRAGKPIQIADVELNSPIVATGVFDQDLTYHVKRMTTQSEILTQSLRTTLYGTLQTVTTKAFTLNVIAGTNTSQWTLPYTSKTTYYDLLDTKIDKKFVKANMQVLAVIPGELTATSSAVRIYVMTPVSTVSATPIQ